MKHKINSYKFELFIVRKFAYIFRVAYLALTIFIGIFVIIDRSLSLNSMYQIVCLFLVMFLPIEFVIFIFKWVQKKKAVDPSEVGADDPPFA